ncbi:stress-induced-phosphoprotein 1-like [Paramacrobiotus metropolitanus]|uniref:stress-induced-phosphoprotein 1-like n=1 Tax=Paramacrobiotus metropolitanus TaxID=2943436 RepID=UPI0024463122|nr:stress-induced-phosphoprotein 1-like [Paramacrobiotus metropolitanus]
MDPKVTEWKDKGNAALQANLVDEAIAAYSEGLKLDPNNEILYSNRSAAFAKKGQYDLALKDGEKAVELKPQWSKGYSRKGAALAYLKRYPDAVAAYEEGLKHEPGNQQLKDGLAECQSAMNARPSQGFPNPFAGPGIMDKLRSDPRTKDFVNQPDFQLIMSNLQRNPQSLMQYLSDPRVSSALSVLLGIDLGAMGADAGEMDTEDYPTPRPSESKPAPSSSSATSAKKPTGKEKPSNLSPEQNKAWDEKELGNEAYKKKDFETALKHYEKAVELDPVNMTYMTNQAAVYFEQGKFQECIDLCFKAIEIGRENRADYQLVAKAFARIGNAYAKMDDNQNAKIFLSKSLAEHRAPDVLKRLQEIEKVIKEEENKAYIDPEKAEEEKNKGNDLFKKGDFPGALKHYSEAVKRNPTDAKLYSNRAACYTKLMEFNLGLKDAEECIKLDPSFVKGYIRKGSILMAMKQAQKATHAFEKALELEPNNQEARDLMQRAVVDNLKDPETARRQAMEDPEVQAIIGDPAMRMILEQMQKDPHAVREHLKNPEVAARIEKLINAGLIGMR